MKSKLYTSTKKKYTPVGFKALLLMGSKERGVLRVGSIPGKILPSLKICKLFHYICININIVG